MFKILTIFSFIICSSFNLFASETKGVVTTIQPINSLVSAVIGNTGKTISLIPAKVSPHEYKLKPSDTKKLQNANIIFFVSDHLESSVTKVFENLPKNIKIIKDEARIRPIDADLQVPDTTKFSKHTGWEPKIKFKKTMEDLLNYWRDRINSGEIFLTR